MKDSMSAGNDSERRPSGKNKGPMVVVVDESSKSSLCDDGDDREKQVEDHLVANE